MDSFDICLIKVVNKIKKKVNLIEVFAIANIGFHYINYRQGEVDSDGTVIVY